MEGLSFTKMQGAGNDYIYINGFVQHVSNPGELAKRISDRHFGVGSDGLVLILPSGIADVRMRMFNADGSEAEMCGNAVRCIGKYVFDRGLFAKELVRVETAAGVKIVRLLFESGAVCGAVVDMGEPIFAPEAIPVRTTPEIAGMHRIAGHPLEVAGTTYAVTALSMGNPHAVVFVDDVDGLDLERLGPLFEHHPFFPQRVNTEFIHVLSSEKVRMRVWERGAGETLACGSGACAAAVASILGGFTGRAVEVQLKRGALGIKWDESDGHVYLKGDAVTVFDGVYPV